MRLGDVWRAWRQARAIWGTIAALFALWAFAASGALTLTIDVVLDETFRAWAIMPRATHDAVFVVATLIIATLLQYIYGEWWLGRRRARADAAALVSLMQRSSDEMSRALEPTRAAEAMARTQRAQDTRRQIEALKRSCLSALEMAQQAKQSPNAFRQRFEEANAALRIEVQTFGRERLGDTYDQVGRLIDQLRTAVSVAYLGPDVDYFRDARETKDAIMEKLDGWLARLRR